MDKKFDVIIIGAGIGGLVAGSLLSKNKKILVLEKNNNFGGYCASFSRDGYKFESAIQAINGLTRHSFIDNILTKAGALNGVKIIKPKKLYRAIFPDHDIVVPQRDLEGYKNLLFSIFPDEKDGIIKLFRVMESIYREIDKLNKEKALKKSPFLLKYGKRSVKELLDEFVKNGKLKAIIAQYWIYRGLSPSKLSATTFSYIWYDYTANGSYFPQDGMDGIINSLVNSIRENGGEVIKGREVSGLRVDGRNITELKVRNGGNFKADFFVSNIDVFKTFDMMEDGDKQAVNSFVNKLNTNTLSLSCFKIYLGLDIDVRDLGVADYEIFINPSYDMEAIYEAAISNDLANTPYTIAIYSNLADAFCRKGHSVVSASTLAGYSFWRDLSKPEYKKMKEKMSDIAISRCEKVLPGIRKYIKVKIVATPLTMERYTGNSDGSVYGWNRKSLVEDIRFMNAATPLKNLFLASNWTKIGGGIAGVLLSSERAYNMLSLR